MTSARPPGSSTKEPDVVSDRRIPDYGGGEWPCVLQAGWFRSYPRLLLFGSKSTFPSRQHLGGERTLGSLACLLAGFPR